MSTNYGAISDRETATMLAALRFWQRMTSFCVRRNSEIVAASDGDPLSDAEIDTLCETINTVDLVWKESSHDDEEGN